MATPTIKGEILTLADVARIAKDPSARSIIEIMSLTNDIIADAPTVKCNNNTTHKTTLRDGIPMPAFRMINEGSPIAKTALRQTTEHTGVLENWSRVDKALLDLSTNRREVLLNESKAFIEGLSQAGAEAIFYGDHDMDEAAFTGFTPRYNTLNPSDYVSRNVIDAGGISNGPPGQGTNLTSIWFVQWDNSACHLLYPDGTTGGIRSKTHESEILYDEEGQPFEGLMVHFQWYLGLAVRDWRRVVRIANVDTSDLDNLVRDGISLQDTKDSRLLRSMTYAKSLLPSINSGKTVIYMCREPHTYVEILAGDRHNTSISYETPVGGGPIMSFKGIPIHRCDVLRLGEDQVTA